MDSSSATRIEAFLRRFSEGMFIFRPPGFGSVLESESETGARGSTPGQLSFELLCEHFHQAQAQRGRGWLVHRKIWGKAHAVITDAERAVRSHLTQFKGNGPLGRSRK